MMMESAEGGQRGGVIKRSVEGAAAAEPAPRQPLTHGGGQAAAEDFIALQASLRPARDPHGAQRALLAEDLCRIKHDGIPGTEREG